jgi:hypothetical protein
MKKLLLFSFISLFVFIACKKDKDEELSLKGLWTLDNVSYKEYTNGVLTDSDTESGMGTTLDFQNNGTLVTKQGVTTGSVPYIIKSITVSYTRYVISRPILLLYI